MDFAKAFTFFTEDPDWITKFAIGAVIVLISPFLLGIPFLLLVGYQLHQTRLVMQGQNSRLPGWDDIGGLFMDGLNLTIALLVYSFPALLLFCLGFVAFFIPVSASTSTGSSDELVGALAGVSVGIWFLMLCLVLLVSLAVAFVTPALNIQYVRNGTLGSLFRFGEVWRITRENLGDIVLAWLALMVANLVLQLVIGVSAITVCGPLILGLVGPIWFLAGTGHLYGQIAAKGDFAAPPKATY